jgi:hypothetical protein
MIERFCLLCGASGALYHFVVVDHRPRYRVEAWRVPNEDGATRAARPCATEWLSVLWQGAPEDYRAAWYGLPK